MKKAERRLLAKRLLSTSRRDCTTGCLLWLGGKKSDGYGSMRWRGRVDSTHRWAWRAKRGRIPKGKSVLHKCDVRNCIYDRHLFLGTQRRNVADMVAKGRHSHGEKRSILFRGERHNRRKLSDAKVRKIRVDHRSETVIAAEYQISRAVVGMVRRRQAWGHVT